MLKHLQKLLLIAALCVPWVTQAQTPGDPVSTFPYSCDFESASDRATWVTVNGTQENGWYIGTATNNTSGGSYALYVSNNSGTSNAYDVTSADASYTWAYQNFTFSAGNYALSFDWKCLGEFSGDPYDFFRVFIVPGSVTLTGGALPSDSYTWSNQFMSDVPTGWIGINGLNTYYCNSNTYTVSGAEFSIATAGSYKLVFLWLNDDNACYNPPAAIDNIVVTENSCYRPTSLTLSDISGNGATLSWTAGGTESSWIVSDGTNSYTTNTTSYTFTGLTPMTDYILTVRAVCSSTDTSVVNTIALHTTCGLISSLPYQNGFEEDPSYSSVAYASAFPDCWTRINDASGTYNYYPYLYATSTYTHTGSVGMYWYQSTSSTYANNEYAILPGIDLNVYDMADLTFSFWAKTTSTSYHPAPIVGVMSDPSDTSTFTPVYNFTTTEITTTWTQFVIPLSSYTGTGNYIAIKWPRPGSTCYMAIDDIFVTDAWCDMPGAVTLSSTVESVTISWESNGATSFEVFLDNDTISPLTDTFYTFNNLTANTNYHYGVASLCANGRSMYVDGNVRTQCMPLDSLPWTENFESAAAGGSTNSTFVNCLTRLNNGSTYFGYPYVSSSSSYNHTSGGTKGLYWYNSTTAGTYGDYQYIVMPGIDLEEYEMDNLQITFWSQPSSTSYHPVFHVGVMTNPLDPDSFVPVDTIEVLNQLVWQEFTSTLENYSGTGNYIAIRALRNSASWYAYVDDITIETIPTCPKPTDVTVYAAVADSVVISWVGPDMAQGYEVAIVPTGASINEDYVSSVLTDTIVVDSLQGGIPYDVYVRTDCGSENSSWSNVVTFTPGSYLMSVTGTHTFYTCGAVIYDDGGPNGNYSASCNSTLYVYPGDSTAALQISGLSYTESSYDYLRIYEGIGTSGTVLFDDYGVSATQTFGPFEISGPVTIYFHSDGSVFYSGFQINVTCVSQPDCTRPENFAIETLLADSVEFSWTDLEGSAWAIEYGPTGFTRGNENDTTIHWANFTDTEGWVENLTPATTYDFYLMTICGTNEGDTSWARKITAKTPCYSIPIDSLPWHYGFEDATTGTSGHLNSCWMKGNAGVSNYYPYVLTTYHAEGTKSLYFYGYSSTYYCYAVMPPFEADIRDLVMDFKLYKTSDSYGSLEIGVMSNPLDISTFTTVAVKQAQALSTWESFRVNFGNYHGTGRFIAFRQAGSYYTYLDDITVSMRVPCPEPINVSVDATSTSSAFVTWSYASGYDVAPDSYQLTLTDNVSNTVTSLGTTTDNHYMITGLTPDNTYTIRVTTNCGTDVSDSDSATFTTAAFGCLAFDTTGSGTPVQIGDGTGTSYFLPIGNFYNYSYTQELYESAELGGYAMPITGISFEYGYSSPSTVKTNVSIYLANVSATSLASAFVPYDASTFKLVYTGSLNASNGWNHYTFDSVFYYDGTSNLLVVIHDNSGSYNGSSYVFKTHPTTGKGRYINNDSSPYSIASPGTGTALAYRANTKFHTFACTTAATCANPLISVTGVTATTVDLVWAPGGSETSWTVEHKASSDASWTTDLTNTTLTEYSYTSLSPNTEYQFRVSHTCGSDNFAATYTVTTPCLPVSLPLFEDFASWTSGTSGTTPSCWYKNTTYSTTYYPYITTGTSMGSDNKSLYFYAPSGYNTWFSLPKFDAPVDTIEMSFYTYYSSTGYQLRVGVMTDPKDFSTFQEVGTVTQSIAYEWMPHEFTFNNMPDGYITIAGPAGGYSYLYVDNINVNYFNPCVRPTNVHSTTTGLFTATLAWTDNVTTDFVLEYGVHGYTQGTGTQVAVSGNTTTLTGLSAGTMYDVYVRGICGEGDSSNWSFVSNFSTVCSTIDTLPYFENFNTWGTGSSVHAPLCWGYGSDYSATYPYIYSSYNHNATGGGSMYMYNYTGNINGLTWLALPELDTTVASINQTQVVFYSYVSTSSYQHNILVGVSNSNGDISSMTVIDTVTAVYGVWTEHEVDLSGYTGTGRYVVLASQPGSGYSYSYPCIDDITLERIPTCQRPNQLTATGSTSSSVTLAWNDRANASQWQIEYGPVGFTPGTGTVVTATTNPYVLTGLPAAYQGEYYVKAICSSTDAGPYSRYPCYFFTQQIPATLPYDYDFETAGEWANWQTCTNTTVDWYRGSAANNNGNTSLYSMYVSADQGTTYSPYIYSSVVNAAVYRDIDFGSVDTSFTISFDARAGGTLAAAYDGLSVFLVDPTIAPVASNSNITSPWGNVNNLYRVARVRLDTTWQTYTASFDTISGVHRVAFFWFNQNTHGSYGEDWTEPAAVDNIHIDFSSCVRPVSLNASAVTSGTANISWQGSSSANYEVVYRQYPGAYDNTLLTTNTNHITLTGLSPLTQYRVWVRKICGAGDTSLYSDGINFTTELCDGAIELFSYDTANTNTTTSSYGPIGYGFYNYSYVQTLVDSARFAGLEGDIIAFAFNPTVTTAGDKFEGMTVWMANVPEANLANGVILPDANHNFVKVIDTRSFSYTTTGWQLHGFDTTFTWDGHSNVLVAVKRDNGSYASGATFAAHSTSDVRTIYYYQDSGPISYTSPSASSTGNQSLIGDMKFVSCGVGCTAPVALPATDVTYQSASINWASNATEFEVAIRTANDPNMPEPTTVSNAMTYNFSGLAPATTYIYQVRAICDAEAGMISDWTMGSFTTDSLPCFAPSNMWNTAAELTTATFDWTVNGEETAWRIYVWNATFSQSYDVTAHPATVTGLTQTTDYYATVVAVCGGIIESETSDTVAFTTATCQPVTNVAVSNIAQTSATVSWSGSAASYTIEYGQGDFEQGNGTTISDITTTTYNISGLTPDRSYSVYVRANCDATNYSAWSDRVQFRTLEQQGIADVNGVNVTIYPNPTTDNTTIALSGVSGDVTITIVDMNGRTVKTDSMSCDGDCVKTVEVSGLAEGAYFVRVNGEGVNMVKKLVVK